MQLQVSSTLQMLGVLVDNDIDDSDSVNDDEIDTLLGEDDMLCKLLRLFNLMFAKLLISLTLTLRLQEEGALSCLSGAVVPRRRVSQTLVSRLGLEELSPNTAFR